MTGPKLFTRPGSVCFQVHLQPRASRDEVAGLHGDAVKIRLTSPPLENRANRHLIDFLAKILDLPKSNLAIVSGHHSRSKTVAVTGVSEAELGYRLGQYLV
ncbi:MAG: DUF167 domain-containing protein [Acidobacteriota bacterium]